MVQDNLQITNISSEGCFSLPAETIYHILRFLDPQDLIRLQTVSRLFQAITRDPAVWRTVYSTARLPLPPGPFLWQSIHFLQRTLVSSARLANAWTTEPLTLISSKIFTGPRSVEDDRFRWVSGRWLLVSKDMKQIRSRDVETGLDQVLWDNGPFSAWAATSLMTPHAHLLCVVVHCQRGLMEDPVTLLEFVADDDTGSLSGPETFHVPTWWLPREAFTPRIRIDSGLGPYVYISLDSSSKPRNALVFVPQRRQFYKFPRFRTQSEVLINYRGAWLPHLVEVYFTETYLFVLSRSQLIHDHVGEVELIQTFAFPDVYPDPSSQPDAVSNPTTVPGLSGEIEAKVTELRLTHEILTREGTPRSVWLTPVRDASIDPVTGATTLRFMHTYTPLNVTPDSRVHLVCTDYILPAPPPLSPSAERDEYVDANDGLTNRSWNTIVRSTVPVLPISTLSHDIFSVPGQWNGNLVDVSHDGFVRGLCMVSKRATDSNVGDGAVAGDTFRSRFTEEIHKFTVDATGDHCVSDVGEGYPPWDDLKSARYYEYAFDGMRGKVSYTKHDVLQRNAAGELVDRDVLAIVVDFR